MSIRLLPNIHTSRMCLMLLTTMVMTTCIDSTCSAIGVYTSEYGANRRCLGYAQVHKLEASLRGQKEALEVEVRGTAGQADSLREQVGQLRNQASHALAASEDKLRSLHTQYDDLLR